MLSGQRICCKHSNSGLRAPHKKLVATVIIVILNTNKSKNTDNNNSDSHCNSTSNSNGNKKCLRPWRSIFARIRSWDLSQETSTEAEIVPFPEHKSK